MNVKNSILLVGLICSIAITSCTPPAVKEFTHRNTLFPLKGIHLGIHCRECHKDGAMTSLPTSCVSCHPMGPSHTRNLGDCDMCHTPTTFSSAFFNHRRAGIPMYGAHLALTGDDCFRCHETNTYTISGGFSCLNCHNLTKEATYFNVWKDDHIHTNTASRECSDCHNQVTFSNGRYSGHSSSPTKPHASGCDGACHNVPYTSLLDWKNVNYSDGTVYGDCSNCHTTLYNATSESDHKTLADDHDCGRCHSTSGWD